MPAPTIETLDTSFTTSVFEHLRLVWAWRSIVSIAVSAISSVTVKQISCVPSCSTDWSIISTFTLWLARCWNNLNATPGLFSRPSTAICTTFSSVATPLTNIFSILLSSLTTVPSLVFKLERTTSCTPYFFAISTERLWSTPAPRLASSSISS